MYYEVISTIGRVSRNALAPVKCLCTILFLNLIDEFELLRIGLMQVWWPLGRGFALRALFTGCNPRLSRDWHCNRVFEPGFLDPRVMSLLVLAVVELICNL